MAKDAKGIELKSGDRVKLTGIVKYAYADLASISLDAPDGQYEPTVCFDPGKVEKLEEVKTQEGS